MKKTAAPNELSEAGDTTEEVQAPKIRFLKSACCPTLSGNASLTYQIACNAEGDCAIHLFAYTGRGLFNKDWVALKQILDLLEQWPADKPITSYALSSFYPGKSTNNRAFLFAALMAEGLVRRTSEKPPAYAIGDPEKFMEQVAALIASDVDLPQPRPAAPDTSTQTAIKKPPKKASATTEP